MTDPPKDPGPIWEQLPVDDPTLPTAHTGVVGVDIEGVPSFRPYLRGMFSLSAARLATTFVLNLIAGLLLWRAVEAVPASLWQFIALGIAATVAGTVVHAFVLVYIAARPMPSARGAWRRIAVTALLAGVALAVLSVPGVLGDNIAVRLLAGLLALVALALQLMWSLAPLVAHEDERMSGTSALRQSAGLLRGYGFGAFWVFMLLELGGLLIWVAVAFGLPGATDWGSLEVRGTVVLVTAATTTLWMAWVADLYRRITVAAGWVEDISVEEVVT